MDSINLDIGCYVYPKMVLALYLIKEPYNLNNKNEWENLFNPYCLFFLSIEDMIK